MKTRRFVSIVTVCIFLALGSVAHAKNDKYKDKDKDELITLADDGDAEAQLEAGKRYNHGLDKDFKKNFRKAEKYLKKAAEQDDAEAEFVLGVMQHAGRGFVKDVGQAKIWYEDAADGGYADAAFTLSLIFEEEGDPDQAAYWYQRAIDSGLGQDNGLH